MVALPIAGDNGDIRIFEKYIKDFCTKKDKLNLIGKDHMYFRKVGVE